MMSGERLLPPLLRSALLVKSPPNAAKEREREREKDHVLVTPRHAAAAGRHLHRCRCHTAATARDLRSATSRSSATTRARKRRCSASREVATPALSLKLRLQSRCSEAARRLLLHGPPLATCPATSPAKAPGGRVALQRHASAAAAHGAEAES
jgi:hypothetical protein